MLAIQSCPYLVNKTTKKSYSKPKVPFNWSVCLLVHCTVNNVKLMAKKVFSLFQKCAGKFKLTGYVYISLLVAHVVDYTKVLPQLFQTPKFLFFMQRPIYFMCLILSLATYYMLTSTNCNMLWREGRGQWTKRKGGSAFVAAPIVTSFMGPKKLMVAAGST